MQFFFLIMKQYEILWLVIVILEVYILRGRNLW